MNEMYNLTIDIHLIGVIVMLLVIGANMIHLKMAYNIYRYAKQMRIVMPIMGSLLALILFTGTVMMAAKHLSFTIENIIMIILNIVWIVIEAKRYAALKHMNPNEENALERYRAIAMKLLSYEFVGSLAISLWMLR